MVRSILYYILLVVFTLLCFIPFAVLFLLTVLFDRERVVLHWASRMWSYGIFRLCPWWRIRIEGAEKIDRSRPWVIVTNHQSMLDIPLMYVLPTTFKWVSKKEVQKMPVFGWVLWMHGDIPVERGSRGSAKQMLERCRSVVARNVGDRLPGRDAHQDGRDRTVQRRGFLGGQACRRGHPTGRDRRHVEPERRLAAADAAYVPGKGARRAACGIRSVEGSPRTGRRNGKPDADGAPANDRKTTINEK